MTKLEEKWILLRKLGHGGNGEVFLGIASSALNAWDAYEKLGSALQASNVYGGSRAQRVRDTLRMIRDLATVDSEADFVAIKVLRKDLPPERLAEARARFPAEVAAYGAVSDRHLLRVREYDLAEGWLVTDYQPGGTLAECLPVFAGDAYRAVHALRPIVEVVGRLHEAGVIHRDIKPENIFLGRLGELILGDMGIAFRMDAKERFTESGQKVGSKEYMPLWAIDGRDEHVNETFDVYSLAKTLWVMIAGTGPLRREYGAVPDEVLTKMFPTYEFMPEVDAFLRRSVAYPEATMKVKTIPQMLSELNALHAMLRRGAQPIGSSAPTMWCKVCGLGKYHRLTGFGSVGLHPGSTDIRVFTCDQCGHVQSFYTVSIPRWAE